MMHQDDRDRDDDELMRALLGSMRHDVAPSHAKRATLAALGIGVTTTALTAYPFLAQAATASPTASSASVADSRLVLTRPCAESCAGATHQTSSAMTVERDAIDLMVFSGSDLGNRADPTIGKSAIDRKPPCVPRASMG